MTKRVLHVQLHLIKEYCALKGLPFREFSAPGTLSLESKGLLGSVTKMIPYGRSHVFLACVEAATVFGRGVVATEDGSVFVHGLTYGNYPVAIDRTLKDFVVAQSQDNTLTLEIEEGPYIDEECVLLWGKENFGHWLFEYLPRIAIAHHAPDLLRRRFLVREDMPKRYLDFLPYFGITKEQLIFAKPSARVRRLWIPSSVFYRGQFSDLNMYLWPPAIHYLRSRVLGDKGMFESPLKEQKKCVYLSRAEAGYRRVANEAPLCEMLAGYNFERYLMTEYSIEQQINIVADADIVLIPEGGGSPITMFAPLNTVVIETSVPNFGGQWASQTWAHILGQRFHRIDGEPVKTEGGTESYDVDYVLPIGQVAESIERALQQPFANQSFSNDLGSEMFSKNETLRVG